VQPLERIANLDGAVPSGIGPAPVDRGRPRLILAVDPRELLASQGRHPSSHIAGSGSGCDACGFTPLARGDIADALRKLPVAWQEALRSDPTFVEPAARLRDELHAVTNRVERVLDEPDTSLASVTIHAPTALATPTSRDVLVSLLHLSANRLADLVESLSTDAWEMRGHVDEGTVTVRELAQVPLHHSHRDLARSRAGDSVVVHFDRGRRKRSW
jgi:hypothetical protein